VNFRRKFRVKRRRRKVHRRRHRVGSQPSMHDRFVDVIL
jgi:hypothetical protein